MGARGEGDIISDEDLWEDFKRGDFELPTETELLLELREMIAHTDLTRGLFFSNHASNYLPLKVRLPSGKAAALAELDRALAGQSPIRAESSRRL